MRELVFADYTVIILYFVVSFYLGLFLTGKAGKSMEHYFVGGRTLPWWALGFSMAATNFSIDTPLAITGIVYKDGIGGCWFFWASAISTMLATFVFAKLWNRSEVVTDAQIVEKRYSGKSASFLRLFKGIYFGLIFNVFIMGWVFLALLKVMGGLTNLSPVQTLVVSTTIVFIYTVSSGFLGVVATDVFQYILTFFGSILLAIYSVREVGGLTELITKIKTAHIDPRIVDFFPAVGENTIMPVSMLLTFVLVQWWAHKYSDGGGKHIQRMLAARSEKHAVSASFFFSTINYALQIWPWIITAVCAMILIDKPSDPEMAYPIMIGRVLPTGVFGLLVVCMIAAFMSTIDTHLNLGASYLVNDIYKRFFVKSASDSHYVWISRLMTAVLLVFSALVALRMKSVESAWKFLLTFASGAGLTWIIRWFWWRANAWTEISAMLTSGVVASYLEIFNSKWIYSQKLCTTVAITTVVWLVVTFLTPPVEDDRLIEFVKKVRPGSPGWNRIYRKYGIQPEPFLKEGILLWLIGLVFLFSLCFGIGSLLLGSNTVGLALLTISPLALAFIFIRLRKSTSPDATR